MQSTLDMLGLTAPASGAKHGELAMVKGRAGAARDNPDTTLLRVGF